MNVLAIFLLCISLCAAQQKYALLVTKFSGTICDGTATQTLLINDALRISCHNLSSVLDSVSATGSIQLDLEFGTIVQFPDQSCIGTAPTPVDIVNNACTTIVDDANYFVKVAWAEDHGPASLSVTAYTSMDGSCSVGAATGTGVTVTNNGCLADSSVVSGGQGSSQSVFSSSSIFGNRFASGTCTGTTTHFEADAGVCIAPIGPVPVDTAVSWTANAGPTYVLLVMKLTTSDGTCTGTASDGGILQDIKSPSCITLSALLSDGNATGSVLISPGASNTMMPISEFSTSNTCTGSANANVFTNHACYRMQDGKGGNVDVIMHYAPTGSFTVQGTSFTSTTTTCSGGPVTSAGVAFTNGACQALSTVLPGHLGSVRRIIDFEKHHGIRPFLPKFNDVHWSANVVCRRTNWALQCAIRRSLCL